MQLALSCQRSTYLCMSVPLSFCRSVSVCGYRCESRVSLELSAESYQQDLLAAIVSDMRLFKVNAFWPRWQIVVHINMNWNTYIAKVPCYHATSTIELLSYTFISSKPPAGYCLSHAITTWPAIAAAVLLLPVWVIAHWLCGANYVPHFAHF